MKINNGCAWTFVIVFFAFLLIGFFELINENTANINFNKKYYASPSDGTRKFIISSYGLNLRNDIYPYVSDYVYDSNFVLVEQIPNTDNYAIEVKSQLEANYRNYDSLTLQQKTKIYWNDFSDSINYLLLNAIKKKVDYFEKHPIKNDTLTTAQKKAGILMTVLESDYRGDFNYYVNKLTDSLISNNPFHKRIWANKINYWILALTSDSLYGPFQKNEYLNCKLTLGVPKKLLLNFE